jgi:hypothetical protein
MGVNSAHCARPACYGTAAAWLAYDYDARCAWLDDDAGGAGPEDRRLAAHVWPLCERHADNLKVPRGWFCVDRRASRFGPSEGDALAAAGPGATGSAPGTTAGGRRPGPAKQGGTRDNDARPEAPGANGTGRLSSIL